MLFCPDRTVFIIVPVLGLVLLTVLVVPTTSEAVFTKLVCVPFTSLPCPTTSILSPVRLLLNPTIPKLLDVASPTTFSLPQINADPSYVVAYILDTYVVESS